MFLFRRYIIQKLSLDSFFQKFFKFIWSSQTFIMDCNKNVFCVVCAMRIIQHRNFCKLCLQCSLVNVTRCWSRERCDDSRRVCPLISHRHQRNFCITGVSARKKVRSLINAIRDGGLKGGNKSPTKPKFFGLLPKFKIIFQGLIGKS